MPTLSKEEQRWRAQSDARTLAEAQVIMSDPKRKAGALKQAKELAKEASSQAAAFNKITKRPSKPASKGPQKKTTSGKKGRK